MRLRQHRPSPRERPPSRLFLHAAAFLLSAFLWPAVAAHAQKVGSPPPAAPPPLLSGRGTAQSSVAPPAFVAAPPVRILYGGRPIVAASPGLAAFRDPLDNALCVAPEALAPLGISFIVDEKAGKVSLAGPAGGATTTVDIRRNVENRVFVPIVPVIEALGGKAEWKPAANTLFLRAEVLSVDILGGQVRIKTSLPVATARVTSDKDRRKTIIDLVGAEVGALPRILPVSAPNVSQARSGQFQEDVARIVLELSEPGTFGVLAEAQPSTLIVVNPLPQPLPPAAAPPRPPAPVVKAPPPMIVVSGVSVRSLSDNKAQIVVSALREPAFRAALATNRLTLDLPNAIVGDGAGKTLEGVRHPLLRAVTLLTRADTGRARLVIDLARVVSHIVTAGPKGLILDLALPRSAGGRLAGKTVVVDAGHGGSDNGARGVNGASEKNVTLAIALATAEKLREAGANVVLTRGNDSYPSLDERCRIANRANADFFLAIHADSVGSNRNANGSAVWHHFQVPSCVALARSLADRLSAVNGLRSRGIRSDRSMYKNGFAVLRGTKMVGVLVECGFLSNAGDANRLVNRGTQNQIAAALVAGLRDYVEGNPFLDTRNINPQSEPTLPFDPAPAGTVEAPFSTVPPGATPDPLVLPR